MLTVGLRGEMAVLMVSFTALPPVFALNISAFLSVVIASSISRASALELLAMVLELP